MPQFPRPILGPSGFEIILFSANGQVGSLNIPNNANYAQIVFIGVGIVNEELGFYKINGEIPAQTMPNFGFPYSNGQIILLESISAINNFKAIAFTNNDTTGIVVQYFNI